MTKMLYWDAAGDIPVSIRGQIWVELHILLDVDDIAENVGMETGTDTDLVDVVAAFVEDVVDVTSIVVTTPPTV